MLTTCQGGITFQPEQKDQVQVKHYKAIYFQWYQRHIMTKLNTYWSYCCVFEVCWFLLDMADLRRVNKATTPSPVAPCDPRTRPSAPGTIRYPPQWGCHPGGAPAGVIQNLNGGLTYWCLAGNGWVARESCCPITFPWQRECVCVCAHAICPAIVGTRWCPPSYVCWFIIPWKL